MRRPTRALLAGALLCLTLGLAACAAGGGSGGEAATLKLVIGDLVPLSGDLKPLGSRGLEAADLALDQINAAIKESGADHTVNINHQDEGEQPAEAARTARTLAEAHDATCITGGWSDAAFGAEAEAVATPGDALLVSPTATGGIGIADRADAGFVSRTVPGPNVEAPALASLVADAVGEAEGKTVSLAGPEDEYSAAFADAFRSAWEADGGKIGGTYESGDAKSAAGDSDAIVLFTSPREPATLAPTVAQFGIEPDTTFVSSAFASSGGASAAANGIRGVMPGAPTDGEAGKAFAQLLPDSRAKGAEGPSFESQAFDAIVVCYLAAVAAGSTDPAKMADTVGDVTGPPGDEYSFDALADAIDAIEGGDEINYVGASGQIDLDIDGNPTVGTYDGFEIKNGTVARTGKQFTAEAAEG